MNLILLEEFTVLTRLYGASNAWEGLNTIMKEHEGMVSCCVRHSESFSSTQALSFCFLFAILQPLKIVRFQNLLPCKNMPNLVTDTSCQGFFCCE